MNNTAAFSRRQFLQTTVTASAAVALTAGWPASLQAQPAFSPPLALFDKILNQTKLSLEDSASLVGEVGLDGVDCAVRPNDRIEPEKAKDDLPRYSELLGKRRAKVLLLTTAIQNPDSPYTQEVLQTARKLGVRFYRLGFGRIPKGGTTARQLAETKPQLRDLAAMNKELGMCALIQNHSASGATQYLGGDLSDMLELVGGFAPALVGVAFDLGHAIIVHGDEWKTHFENLKSHIQVAYIKDADRKRRFVRFSEGEFSRTDYFSRLKAMNYRAPLSVHIEYDWAQGGPENRETLAAALRESLGVLRKWVAAA